MKWDMMGPCSSYGERKVFHITTQITAEIALMAGNCNMRMEHWWNYSNRKMTQMRK
jgi:hypothetical protein